MASKSKRSSTKTRPKKPDAIALLKADHRQAEEWFSKFENARSSSRKQQLADDICAALQGAHAPLCESGEHCLKPRAAQRDRTALTAVAVALDCSLETGSTLHLTPDQYTHLRRLFTEGALREACQGCEWHAFCTTVAAQDFAATKLMPQK